MRTTVTPMSQRGDSPWRNSPAMKRGNDDDPIAEAELYFFVVHAARPVPVAPMRMAVTWARRISRRDISSIPALGAMSAAGS